MSLASCSMKRRLLQQKVKEIAKTFPEESVEVEEIEIMENAMISRST